MDIFIVMYLMIYKVSQKYLFLYKKINPRKREGIKIILKNS